MAIMQQIISLLIFMLVWPAGFACADVRQELTGLLSAYQNYAARFTQTLRADNGKVLQTARGRVWIKRPNQFRWVIQDPQRQIIVSDGTTIKTYNVDLQQVTVRPYRPQKDATPAVLLSGRLDRLLHYFIIERFKQGYSLTPRSAQVAFRQIVLYFQNKKLRALMLLDKLDQKTLLIFDDVRINQTMRAERFQLKVSPNVDVIQLR